jgi:SAM-dependent methyltransferase
MAIEQHDTGVRRHGHHQHDHSAGHSHGDSDEGALAELLDLDGEVLHSYLADVVDWVATTTGPAVTTVVDLGAGTGTGTMALARRFPAAEVVAVDASESMLARLREASATAGVTDRVRIMHADLDAGWPGGMDRDVDLVWAALSLHHVTDPESLLTQVHDALRSGGVLAVTEMATPVRFLPDDLGLGRPGLESRCLAALDAQPSPFNRYPNWDDALARAGFPEVERHEFSLTPAGPEPATGRYAWTTLARMRSRLAGDLDMDDLATLDLLLDDRSPHSLLRRSDLVVRGTRTGWLARRS